MVSYAYIITYPLDFYRNRVTKISRTKRNG